jgi:mannose-6-phosphate isomerase-like protein (cupin superfamily)
MQVTKFKDAKRYEAANHVDVSALRLQGAEATKTSTFWTGVSHYLPGGKAEKSASDYERVYMVLDGEITVTTDQGSVVLGPMDSVHIAPKETRIVENRANTVCTMLVIVSNAKVTP